ncbi:MAG TPA: Ig-like domain-containing protein, partial [Terriglobales bacterium]
MRSLRNLSFVLLLAGFLLLAACGDFFVSQNAIDTVSFTPNAVLLKTGDTITLTPVVTTVGGTQSNPTSGVTWTSSNTSVAAIDDAGKVTAGITTGTSTIKATYSNVSGTGTAIVTASTLPTTLTVSGNQTILLSS